MSAATFTVGDVRMLVAAAKLRRFTRGRTCQLAALSAGPVIEVDCASNSHWTRPGMREQAQRLGLRGCNVTPLQRGHIALVYERIARTGGRREVLRTWGTGIRALRAEPRYVLNGGEAAA